MFRYQPAPITSLSLNPSNDDLLVITYSDNRVAECHAKTGRHTTFSKSVLSSALPKSWLAKKTATLGAVQIGEEKVIFHDGRYLLSVDRKPVGGTTSATPPRSKQSKRDSGKKEAEDDAKKQARLVSKYNSLIHLGALADGTLVAVEVRPQSIEEQLPPSLRQKKFGAM